MTKLFTLFLLMLEKLGRHEVLVDGLGRIYWHRYYLFYKDNMDNPRWFDYLPNAYIHIFGSAEPDGEDEHNHPWNSLSFLIKGRYVENINLTETRETKAGRFAWLSHKDSHRLANVEQGTTTLFMHGFRWGVWKFHIRPHENICDLCKTKNGGVCFKKPAVLNYTEYIQRGEGGEKSYSKTRTMTWTIFDDAFRKKWERRVAAVEKMGVKVPATKAEARVMLIEEMVKKAK